MSFFYPLVEAIKKALSAIVLNVDILATEASVGGEINTATETSPVTVVTPSTGKKIDTRSVYLASNSTSGEVEARFRDSGKLLGKIYCSKFRTSNVGLDKDNGERGRAYNHYVVWAGSELKDLLRNKV